MRLPDTKTPAGGAGVQRCKQPAAEHDGEGTPIVQAVPHARAACRLPAFGRDLRDALTAGYRPRWFGGAVLVTTDWRYATAARGARLVCPPGEPVSGWDLSFLRGVEVLVVVPERDELLGEALRARIVDAGAARVVLAVNRADDRHEQ